ncbi:class I SAM-dependent methyltransferase [Chloroflexota bacterium]
MDCQEVDRDTKAAGDWDRKQLQTRGGYYDFFERIHFLSKWGQISKQSLALSVGSGTGHHEQVVGCERLFCLDISRERLNIAKDKGLICVQGTALQLPFPDDVFDCVFGIDLTTIHYTQDMRTITVNEMVRVSKKGGRIIVISRNELQNKVINLILHQNADYDPYRVKQSDIKKTFMDSQVYIERSINIGYPYIHSKYLDKVLAKLRLDILGHWSIICGVKR